MFDTEEKVKDAIAAFRQLLTQPGWKLFVQIVDENINLIRLQLEEGVEGETKSDVDRLRDKLKILKEMRNTPENILAKLESDQPRIPDADPFETVEELRAKRRDMAN